MKAWFKLSLRMISLHSPDFWQVDTVFPDFWLVDAVFPDFWLADMVFPDLVAGCGFSDKKLLPTFCWPLGTAYIVFSRLKLESR